MSDNDTIDLDALQIRAQSADKNGEHIFISPRDSNTYRANLAFQAAASAKVVMQLIAIARRAGQVKPAAPRDSTGEDALFMAAALWRAGGSWADFKTSIENIRAEAGQGQESAAASDMDQLITDLSKSTGEGGALVFNDFIERAKAIRATQTANTGVTGATS